MADRRKELQAKLEELRGNRNVYFQPPENFKMKYPCIVYGRFQIRNRHADDGVYKQDNGWQLTNISTDQTDDCVQKLSRLPKCRHVRTFIADNLYHDVFELYF